MRTTASWFADAASLRAYRKGWPERREERGVGSLSDPRGAFSLCRGFGEPCEFRRGPISRWLRYPSACQDGLVSDHQRSITL